MPTAAKLAAAAAFAIVAAIAAHLFIPALPEGTPPGCLREVWAAIGLLCGWWIMGNRVGKGYARICSLCWRRYNILSMKPMCGLN